MVKEYEILKEKKNDNIFDNKKFLNIKKATKKKKKMSLSRNTVMNENATKYSYKALGRRPL